tara:strand:+ start:371 stop:769 length:399 start_codon:yes stop_codon:yes gene_type:complete
MSWQDISKVDIQGLRQSFPALKNLPDDAIREFASKINNPMVKINRLLSELQQKYMTGMRPAVGRMVKEERSEAWFQQLKATGSVTSSSAAGGGPSNSATTEGISFFDSQGNPSLRFGKKKRRKKHGKNKERC